MKKFIVFIVAFILIIGVFIYFSFSNTKTSNSKYNSSNDENILNEINNVSIPQNIIKEPKNIETEISTFSTDLQGDEARLNNIRVTCNTINGTVINPGETFSFNNIVGKPSEDKGYQEADVIVDTHVEKGFGGGNCQVSTTIYNACLNLQELEIIERNPHKKSVYYIEEGKDASVSYSGGLDFKFKNNFSNPIKIYIDSENNQVTAKLVKIQS